eukprot:3448991-Amphidinium_carterae.1
MKNIKALPPVSSASTRKATGFWREEWGARNHESLKEKKLLSKDTVQISVLVGIGGRQGVQSVPQTCPAKSV